MHEGLCRRRRTSWTTQDSPTLFTTNLELRWEALPQQGEAQNIPWAGSYWPTYEDNINHRWAGASSDSPSLKYQKAFTDGGVNVEDLVSKHHGIESVSKTCKETSECDSFLGETCAKRPGKEEGRCVATWWGICHAWTPAAILFPEPKSAVTRNGVTFQVQDLKALASLVHNSTRTKFVSLRCNKHNSTPDGGGIKLDAYGRPVDTDRECRDTNAGTYHVLLANYLGLMKQAFAEDRTNSYEVWNQPIRGFKVTAQNELTVEEANRLIGVTATDGGAPLTTYRFNPNAVRFISVKAEVKYIGESSADEGYVGRTRIDWYTHTDRYEYVLELDSAGKIIGGEWVGSSKTNHPDFLWLPLSASGTVAGGSIRYDVVKALVMESAGQGALVGAAVEVNESATLAKGEWRHFGPFSTAAGAVSVELSGTGDADLYVRMNGQPSLNLYDCRPYTGTSNESCTLEGPGALYVSVHGYSAATLQLKVKYVGAAAVDGGVRADAGMIIDAGVRPDAGWTVDAGIRPDAGTTIDAGVRPDAGLIIDGGTRTDAGTSIDAGAMLDAGMAAMVDAGVAHLSVNGTVTQGELRVYSLPVTAGRAVVVRTVAGADVDLYVKMDLAPTITAYDSRGYTASGNETVRFTPMRNGVLYVGVHGYRPSSFTLTTADQ